MAPPGPIIDGYYLYVDRCSSLATWAALEALEASAGLLRGATGERSTQSPAARVMVVRGHLQLQLRGTLWRVVACARCLA